MQTVKFRAEMCTAAPSDSIFSGPATYVLAILCVLMKVLSHASAKRKQKCISVSNFALLMVVYK